MTVINNLLFHPVVVGTISILLGLGCFYLRVKYPEEKNSVIPRNFQAIFAGLTFFAIGILKIYRYINELLNN